MMSWTNIVLSFSFLSCFQLHAACEFKSHFKKIYSLSGPITQALIEFDLLGQQALNGVSIFHPVDKTKFKGRLIPGGVFLSPLLIQDFSGAEVFFDQSQEMRKAFQGKGITLHELKTRGLTPRDASMIVLSQLTPLLSNCEEKIKNYQAKILSLENEIKKKIQKPIPVIFFLGTFLNNRPPEMIMVNDGVVKWLKEINKIQTYPSELAYLSWSSKILGSLPPETLKVGIKDSGAEMTKDFKRKGNDISVIYPGALIPGIGQLEAWNFWLENL